ncbi:MAG: phosphoglucosamine mutase [Actinomycetota bacterium]|nr:phosphoglucosamine mutase [Actinomycetota bacterium]
MGERVGESIVAIGRDDLFETLGGQSPDVDVLQMWHASFYRVRAARSSLWEDDPVTRLFGTDGVRGIANRDLTPDLALTLGRAAGSVLAGPGPVVLGRDTRISGPMLEAALAAGLCSAGLDVALAGVLPTPAVSFLTVDVAASAGGMVSASHNPVDDNGIKFFSTEGAKVSSEIEAAIESAMESPSNEELPVGTGVGGVQAISDAADRYVDHLVSTLRGPLQGLRVVLDCAYGAAWEVGPRAFARAGAAVVAMNAEPDGSRINVDCGSTSLGPLSRRVLDEEADLGIALDGDADRMLAVDERGMVIDGDAMLAITAVRMAEAGELNRNVVVTTVMANLGLQHALAEHAIEVLTVPVGDRFVSEAMLDAGSVLGGEQSGHIIFGAHARTGDGILAGLQLASFAAASDEPVSQLVHLFEPFPQVLINVRVTSKEALGSAEPLWEHVTSLEERLGQRGRVLLRASGTEPLIRVMVEAQDEALARASAESLADIVRAQLGAPTPS